MTVAELIEHLKQYPPEMEVFAYDASEDWSKLTAEGIRTGPVTELIWINRANYHLIDKDKVLKIIGG